MSTRAALIAALRTALPANKYRVSDKVAVPDQIDPNKYAVRVLTKTVTPGPMLGMLTTEMNVWVLTGSFDPAAMDAKLDVALNDLLVAFLGMQLVSFRSAERGVMNASGGESGWHGYLFTLSSYSKIEGA